MRCWTSAQARAFLAGVKGDSLEPFWRLALATGMRRGELLGLKWGDIDSPKARVAVRRAIAVIDGVPIESEPKTRRGRRTIPIDETSLAVLKQQRVRDLERALLLGRRLSDEDYVFSTADGGPLNPDAVSKRFRRLARAADLPLIRLHDLRHTHATLALEAGIHPKVVSERLGHGSVAITLDTYSHAVPSLESEAAERIEELLAF
jgi:integrase